MHAASVGEGQAAVPVIVRLRAARPDLRIVLTYSSPSMARWPHPWPVDRADYLPLDEPGPVAAVLDALRPDLLCFSRGDLWPELLQGADARAVPVAVIGAVVRPGSTRLRPVARRALRGVHRVPVHVGAASDYDAARWMRLGVPADRVTVTGDPRHDWVLERAVDLGPARAVAAWAGGAPVLIAGSLESDDIAPVVRGIALARAAIRDLRVLAVPHDPRLATRLRGAAPETGLEFRDWAGPPDVPAPDAHGLVVSGVGRLADLYLAAAVAYVGGGFRPGRLHAVVEPAAFGVPLAAGPDVDADRDGRSLVAAGAAASVGNAADLARQLVSWVRDPDAARRAGLAGRGVLADGAARREAGSLLALLGTPPPSETT